MRLGDLDALRKNMEFICMGIMAGTEPYNAPLTEIDNAPTVYLTKNQAYDKGFITAMKLYARPQADYEIPKDYIKNELDYKVINRGKCMLCGKELTEGLFFCKECEKKGDERR